MEKVIVGLRDDEKVKIREEKKRIRKERSAMIRADQESRADIIRARRKEEIDLIFSVAEDVVKKATYLESHGNLDRAQREVQRLLFSHEFCRIQSRLNKLPLYDAVMKILMRANASPVRYREALVVSSISVERQERLKSAELERQERCRMDEEERFLTILKEVSQLLCI